VLGPPDGPAVEVLADLVALYDAGRREPLPLPMKTSYAWSAAVCAGDNAVKAAGYRWKTTPRFPGEDQQPAHVKAWGDDAWQQVLLAPPRPGEAPAGEDTRMGAFAARLWLPMLTAERRAD
jgi:exodeoxyribonuclease V gamma subunit